MEDTDVVLNIKAKTEDAEAKIRRLESQLKSSAGSALTEAQGRVKKLEQEIKRAAAASQMSFGQMAANAMSAVGRIDSAIRTLSQAIDANKKMWSKMEGQLAAAKSEAAAVKLGYDNVADGLADLRGMINEAGDDVRRLTAHFSQWNAVMFATGQALRGVRAVWPTDDGHNLDALLRGAAAAWDRIRSNKAWNAGGGSGGGTIDHDGGFGFGSGGNGFAERWRVATLDATAAAERLAYIWDGVIRDAQAGAGAGRFAAAGGTGQIAGPDYMVKATSGMSGRAREQAEAMAGAETQRQKQLRDAMDVGNEAIMVGADLAVAAEQKSAKGRARAQALIAKVKALWEVAESVAAFATRHYKEGALHALAAVKYGLVVSGAGEAAAGLGSGGGGGGGGGGYSGGGGGGYMSAPRPEASAPVVININGSVGSDDGPRILRQIEQAVRSGRSRQGSAASF